MNRCICERPDLHTVDGAVCCLGCGYYSAPQEHVATAYSNEHANYHYKSLDSPSSIRLVRLCGGPRSQGIVCGIFHTTLESHDEFEALSYTWGDGANFRTIHTPEGRLKITENCFSALEDLRYENEDRILWIDAICINQRSNSEKNHQVPLMNKIYRAASQVLIYLGRDPRYQHSERFFKLWRGIRLNQDNQDPGYGEGSSQDRQREMSEFLSLPWWSRVWILQEVAVARKALLVWGGSTMEWELFSAARVTRQGYLPVNLQENIPPVLMFSGNDPRPLNSFDALMHTARCSRSSEPRDKIYALLGLLDEHVVHNIVADYNRPLSELYAEFAMCVIDSHRNLDLLCMLGRETMSTKEAYIVLCNERFWSKNHHTSEQTRMWTLTRRVRLDAQSTAEQQLQSPPKCYREHPRPNLPSWVPQLDNLPMLSSLSRYYRYYSERHPITSMPSICTEVLAHNHPALKIRLYRMASARSYEESKYVTDDYQSKGSFLGSVVPYAEKHLHSEVENFAKNRQVLFTRYSWIICSYDTRVGDEICFIDGAKTLFALRPVEQTGECRSFKLLGECYLDTIGYTLSTSFDNVHHLQDRVLSLLSEYDDQQWEDACLV